MKWSISLLFILAAVAFAGWRLTRTVEPIAYSSGQVESTIHSFGPQLDASLNPNATFNKTATGFQPKPEPPQAPVGMKPQELQAWTSFAVRHDGVPALMPTFPAHYSEGTQVQAQGMSMTLTPLKSNAAPAQIENGKLVYHNAYASTDSMNVVSDGRSEEFLLLHDAQAPQRFDYDLSATAGVKDISLVDNAINFTGADGRKVQIEAPWLVETGGQKVANAVHWEINYITGYTTPRVTLVVDHAAQLHYPVVIDPSWIVANGMSTARVFHTATLLTNGLVFVVGGQNTTDSALTTTELFDPTTGTWTAGKLLNIGRSRHTATLLLNGTVLIAGGEGSGGTTDARVNCALYNPFANKLAATGSLNAGRYNHTATLLANGQVLVAGGTNGNAILTSSELYDPSTASWTTINSPIAAREYHTATLLSNGKVLVAGGIGSNPPVVVATAQIYDPTANTWSTTTPSMHTARLMHTATLLTNGKVLVAGGSSSVSATNQTNVAGIGLNTAEIFDPTGNGGAGTWTTVTGSNMIDSLYAQSATILPSGQVFLTGGVDENGNMSNDSEMFTYSGTNNGSWLLGFNLQQPRRNHTMTLLPSSQVLLTGGQGSFVLANVEFNDLVAGTWTATGALKSSRQYHTATVLTNGTVLAAGGTNSSLAGFKTAELFDPIAKTWTATGSLSSGHCFHTATLLTNGQVLVAGGIDDQNLTTGVAELYNPTAKTWATTASLHTPRTSHTATLLTNGEVLVAGGIAPFSTNAAELYDPVAKTWTTTGSLQVARNGHAATLLPNGKVLVVGGLGPSNVPQNTAELYDPTTMAWTSTPNMSVAHGNPTVTLLPSGLVLVAGGDSTGKVCELYNPSANTWTTTGSLNFGHQGDPTTLLLNGEVLVSAGNSEIYTPSSATNGTWKTTTAVGFGVTGATASLLPSTSVNGILSEGQVLLAGGNGTNSNFFDPGFNYGIHPSVNTVTSLTQASSFKLTGNGLGAGGATEGSGGGSNNSASNIPVVQLRSLANSQVLNLTLDSSNGFSSTSFPALAPGAFPPGYALLTLIVNGTPSFPQIVPFTETAQPITNFPSSQTLAQSASPVTLTAKAPDGETITYTVSGPATISGDKLTFTGSGQVAVSATTMGNSTYAALSETDTITVTPLPIAGSGVDSPAMPPWALAALAVLLVASAGRFVPAKLART